MSVPTQILKSLQSGWVRRRWAFIGGSGVLVLCVVWTLQALAASARTRDFNTARVERRAFDSVVRRIGRIEPLREEHIIPKLRGTVTELAEDGQVVHAGDVVLKLDPLPFEDALAAEQASVAQQKAEYKNLHAQSLKALNQAREDIKSNELRVQLETARLDELKKGPTLIQEINARSNLNNNEMLYKAREEEHAVIAELAADGYATKEEARQKELEAADQHVKVIEADIAHRKLNLIDEGKLADQRLKVQDAQKTRDAAKENALLLERNIKRDEERFQQRMEREDDRLKDLAENLQKSTYRASREGVVLRKRTWWGQGFAPGREVRDGQEVCSLPDLSEMKVVLPVDEGRIAHVSVGQMARVTPAGWPGAPLEGIVVRVAEKGHDEFEFLRDDTTSISGKANRQVFDVEVAIKERSQLLRPNLRAEVEIILGQISNALVVPRTAVVRSRDGVTHVLICDGLGVEERPVKLLAEHALCAAVEGVKEGENVIAVP